MFALTLITATSGFQAARLPPPVRAERAAVRFAPIMREMDEEEEKYYEEYVKKRGTADMEAAQTEYLKFKTLSLGGDEFDGGDSGSGAVGDGNVDLEDQHNSATLGALRGGVSEASGATMAVGRGNVLANEYTDLPDESRKEKGATEARTASAGKNYFGRTTGLAEKLIEQITDDDVKTNRMDRVRAQQKENWFNQRAIHAQNRAQGQGVVYGQENEIKPREGGYIAREALVKGMGGEKQGEISQRDLADHLQEMATTKVDRLDGEEWGELTAKPDGAVDETYSLRSTPRNTVVEDIPVKNDYNTFAPFHCDLLPGSSKAFTVTPHWGSMNRRSGEPTSVVVRYTPQETGVVHEATLVFETEDMKKVYKFIGST